MLLYHLRHILRWARHYQCKTSTAYMWQILPFSNSCYANTCCSSLVGSRSCPLSKMWCWKKDVLGRNWIRQRRFSNWQFGLFTLIRKKLPGLRFTQEKVFGNETCEVSLCQYLRVKVKIFKLTAHQECARSNEFTLSYRGAVYESWKLS